MIWRVKMLCYRGQLHPQNVVVDGCLILSVKYLRGCLFVRVWGKWRVVARCVRKVGYIFA